MAHIVGLKLPELLREKSADVKAALLTPVLMTWDERVKFAHAAQPEAIGAVLVDAIHTPLRSARIGYLFREKNHRRDTSVWAQARKVTGKLAHYSELDLLIEVNWLRWNTLQAGQKLALIDHELQHFAHNVDEKGDDVYALVSHDIEEFTAIVRRWGGWRRELQKFATALEMGTQLELFGELGELQEAAD
jgi:hypothetical protein